MSFVSQFISQFSSFRARPLRRDLELRALRIKGVRSLLTFIIAITTIVFVTSFLVSAFKPKRDLQNELVKGDNLVFEKPSFTGHSLSGGRIIVTATEATKSLNTEHGDINLQSPVVTTQSGSILSAKTGIWNQINQRLLLRDAVSVKDKNGNIAKSDYAFWGLLEQKENPNENVEKLYLTGNVTFVQPNGDTLNSASAIWNENISELLFSSNPISQISGNNGANIRVNGKLAGLNLGADSLRINSETKTAFGSGNISINSKLINAGAQTFEFHFDSKHLILRGNARATYAPN